MTDHRGRKGATWRRIRREVLERDGYRCQLVYVGCTTAATEVDHVVPLVNGGHPTDPGNLRAVCRTCHRGRAPDPAIIRTRQW